MTEKSEPGQREAHLSTAYRRMLERARAAIERVERDALPRLQHRIADARERAVELGELTREEAERVGEYLRRDVEDAARYLGETGGELKDWLRFDLELVEERLVEMFGLMVDETRLELDRIAREALDAEELQAGEVTGLGTLQCLGCGEELEFQAPGPIPPCARCQGTRFRRVSA
jgi:hypothetical protein